MCCKIRYIDKINWDNFDLENLYKIHGTYTKIADILGISDAAVIKRFRKLGIYKPKQRSRIHKTLTVWQQLG